MNDISFNLADALLRVVQKRHTDDHAKSDCDLVLDSQWSASKAAFLYGIAHNLRHAARRNGLNPDTASIRCDDLVRFVGWADEFFWLSCWRLTGKLSGPPEPAESEPLGAFLLVALQTCEWAGLLNEVHWYQRRLGLKNEDFPVWRTLPDGERERGEILRKRVESRLQSAESAVNEFRKRGRAEQIDVAGCSKDLRRHICIERARNSLMESMWDPDEAVSHMNRALHQLDDALGLAATPEDHDFIAQLKNEFKAGLPFKGAFEKETRVSYQPLEILATWIMDLLVGEDGRIVHPRTSLRKEELPANADAHDFPNVNAIQRIEKRLADHRSWLKFANRQKDFAQALRDISEAERLFRDEAFPKKAPPLRFGDWDLFVLRDWASYTPLVPPQTQGRPRRLGGGYFLRTDGAGVAIDPGYDFIENLYKAGLNIAMVTDIIVTHEHYDHVASFGPLLTLLHEYFEKREEEAKKTGNINFLICRNVLDHHARLIVDLEKYGRIEPLTDADSKHEHEHRLSDDTKLFATHTEHGSPSGFGRGGVGLKFVFEDDVPTLGITSDTGWYPKPSEQRPSPKWHLRDQFLQGDKKAPEVMVLHVGSLKPEELQDSGFYKTHLGARGVFHAIDSLSECRLAILGEFGEECLGYRAWFANCINEFFTPLRANTSFRCLPSDRKTLISAKGGELFVWREGDFVEPQSYQKVKSEEARGEIKFRLT